MTSEAPPAPPRALRVRLFGIDASEASFARRGFAAYDDAARERLELCGRTFVTGYRAGLAQPEPTRLTQVLDEIDAETRGFAYEGAAMALALLDQLEIWRRRSRLRAFIAGPARAHVYMAHVGAGWALARLRRRPRAARALDPLLGWLAVDGYGFHEGYFDPARRLVEQRVPSGFTGYARRAFDQGLGRSLWFAVGASPCRAAAAVRRFPSQRRPDVWSGVGLAAAYAGPASPDGLALLRTAAGSDAVQLAQGAAFAAAARDHAGNPAAHTALACRVLAGCSATAAAELTIASRRDLPADVTEPAYEVWRARLRVALQDARR
jgi:enediyne biosynthesis protein E3